MKTEALLPCICTAFLLAESALACTGITMQDRSGSRVYARTIEWGGSDLKSRCVIVPRGTVTQSMLPGQLKGLEFTAKYGYAGIAVEQADFVAEGLNEAGLSAGLFYFPEYGGYPEYDGTQRENTVCDLQVVPWLLSSFASVEEAVKGIMQIRVTGIDPRASTVHWRIADASGRQVVVEIIDGRTHVYENEVGVITNAPDFKWHLANLSNYVNLFPGGAQPQIMGGRSVKAFGAGSGFLGLPGDITPPSRFVRAAFFQYSSPAAENTHDAVLQAFQILNNFDIPIGIEFRKDQDIPKLPSATQWTSAADPSELDFYYRTMNNSAIRRIRLSQIDFSKVRYTSFPVDEAASQPVTDIKID